MPLLGNYEQVDYSPSYDRILQGGAGVPVTMGEDGTLVSVWCFFSRLSSGSGVGRLWGAIYDGWELTGNALFAESDTYTDVTPSENASAVEFPVSAGGSLLNGEVYGAAANSTVAGGFEEVRIMTRDTTYNIQGDEITGYNYAGETDPAWPDPMSRGASLRAWCTWLEYEVGGGGGSQRPRKRRAIGNIPMGAALQLRQRGIEVVTCDSIAKERARSRIAVPHNWFELGGRKSGYVHRDSGIIVPQ